MVGLGVDPDVALPDRLVPGARARRRARQAQPDGPGPAVDVRLAGATDTADSVDSVDSAGAKPADPVAPASGSDRELDADAEAEAELDSGADATGTEWLPPAVRRRLHRRHRILLAGVTGAVVVCASVSALVASPARGPRMSSAGASRLAPTQPDGVPVDGALRSTPPGAVLPLDSKPPPVRDSASAVAAPAPTGAGEQAATRAPATPAAAPLPSVAPLSVRVVPDVFVQAPRPLTEAEVSKVRTTVGATSTELVAVGPVALGHGTTTALGVDPSSFRTVAPKGTAESTQLWQSVLAGDVAVAHTVARALAVPLGGQTSLSPTGAQPASFRVGAFATTGLPGVGVVVDQRFDDQLGLMPHAGLVVAAPGKDPVVTAALVHQALGDGVTATPLRVPVGQDGRLSWVPPAVGPVTSGFGPRVSPGGGAAAFHGGIDIGAGFGAPIYAASAGTVVYAGAAAGFGSEVVLQHAGNVQTVYGHMERILVTAGTAVRAGQPIALVGSAGESTGPHLHFEVHVSDGSYVDPLPWLVAHGVRVDR